MAELVRLQKFLKDTGLDSRRKCEEFISEGLVKVNGRVVREMGTKIDPERDVVDIFDKKIRAKQNQYRTIIMNKPRGYVCSRNDSEGKTVYSLLRGIKENLSCIGRLDKKSEGLLIFSNDGELVYRLSHPSFGYTKIYNVMVTGEVNEQTMKILNSSMEIDGYRIRPALVKKIRPGEKPGRWLLQFTLKEGRNRQIRKMCEQVNLDVKRLTRIQIKDLKLLKLKPGEWKDISRKEIQELLLKNQGDKP